MSALRQGEPCELLDATESDVALRQLTSGSTGTPKAVEISHGNLAANGIAIRTALAIVPGRDVSVSWLPLSHDMGMIAFLCLPMRIGSEAVVVTPDQFLRRPIVWAELISRYKATITSGPNFAYTVLTRLLQRADPASIDLSSLRVAVNGAEPIDQKDLSTFAEVGARFGLRASAPRPAYGLAEATLVVSFGPPDCAPVVDRVSRDGIAARVAKPVSGDDHDGGITDIVCVGPTRAWHAGADSKRRCALQPEGDRCHRSARPRRGEPLSD